MRSLQCSRALFALFLCAASTLARAEDIDAGPYVPTPQYIVDRMLRMASVGANDYVIDLGSGDGRIVITAAKAFGARGMGVDISEKLVAVATANSQKENVADKVRFVRQDAFKTDISPASVLTLYLLPKFVLDLRPRMLAQLKPGSRIVSHDYSLGDWDSDNRVTFDTPEKELINGSSQTTLYYYVVPARVAGTWRINLPDGLPESTLSVLLNQSYQSVSGNVGDARGRALSNALLRGDRIELGVPTGSGIYQFAGQVSGDRISGTVEVKGKGSLPFSATRTAPGKAIGWQ